MYLWFSTHFRLAWQKLRYCKITDYQEKFARTIKSYMSQAALLQCLPIRRNSSGSYHLDIYLGGKFFFLKRVTSLKPLAQRPLSIIENRPSVQVYSSIQICSVYWTTLNLPEVKNKMWGSITVFELGKQTLNRVFENENLWPIKKIFGEQLFPLFPRFRGHCKIYQVQVNVAVSHISNISLRQFPHFFYCTKAMRFISGINLYYELPKTHNKYSTKVFEINKCVPLKKSSKSN